MSLLTSWLYGERKKKKGVKVVISLLSLDVVFPGQPISSSCFVIHVLFHSVSLFVFYIRCVAVTFMPRQAYGFSNVLIFLLHSLSSQQKPSMQHSPIFTTIMSIRRIYGNVSLICTHCSDNHITLIKPLYHVIIKCFSV